MIGLTKFLSLFALAASIIPSCLFYSGTLGHEQVKWSAIIGTLVWFLATPNWMGKQLPVDAAEVEI